MGINHDMLKYFDRILKFMNKDSWHNVTICEYGNQHIKDGFVPFHTAKEWFVNSGAKHISIDINGMDGSLKLDLSKKISGIGEPFDLITNCGTIEHVAENQYWPFKNFHNLVSVGGIMFHVLPLVGNWRGHGYYHYELSFAQKLAYTQKYEVMLLEILKRKPNRNLIIAIYKKHYDEPFLDERLFGLIGGIK